MARAHRSERTTLAEFLEMNTSPEPMSGCFLWTGFVNRQGYGRIRWQGRNELVHRLSYELSTGVHPGAKFVCHKCDNPSCLNPDHLFLGTAKDNNKDRASKGRNMKGYWGGAHPRAILTDAQVVQIRIEYVKHSRDHGTPALARKHGVTQQTVWEIVTGKIRKRLRAA